MCGQARQSHVDIHPGMTLTVRYEDGSYHQHTWGIRSKGKLVYNARQEELVETWGARVQKVLIPLDGFYEKGIYFDTPITAKGIIVQGCALIVTMRATGRVAQIHDRQPAMLVG